MVPQNVTRTAERRMSSRIFASISASVSAEFFADCLFLKHMTGYSGDESVEECSTRCGGGEFSHPVASSHFDSRESTSKSLSLFLRGARKRLSARRLGSRSPLATSLRPFDSHDCSAIFHETYKNNPHEAGHFYMLWRWGESNPRPTGILCMIYRRSLFFPLTQNLREQGETNKICSL